MRVLLSAVLAVGLIAISPAKAQAPLFDKAMHLKALPPKEVARSLAVNQHDWNQEQFKCLGKLWGKESAWNYKAKSPTQDYGIPQRHMSHNSQQEIAKFLSDPVTQITWGLNYIKVRYGSPCEALKFHNERNWY